MAIAHIVSTSAGGTASSTVTSSAVDTTGANLIVVAVSVFGTNSVTVSDSKSNTPYTALTARTQATQSLRMYYFLAPSVGSGHTFTASGTSIFPTISVSAFSGVATSSALDQESGTTSASGGTTFQPGSITPSQDNCLLVTGVCSSGNTHSINGSFNATSTNEAAGQHVGGGIAYKIQTTAGAENPTWTWVTSTGRAAGMASFKPAVVSAALLFATNEHFYRNR